MTYKVKLLLIRFEQKSLSRLRHADNAQKRDAGQSGPHILMIGLEALPHERLRFAGLNMSGRSSSCPCAAGDLHVADKLIHGFVFTAAVREGLAHDGFKFG